MRVLLVDDEVELVSALGERLVIRGIEAEWVGTGEEALQRVAREAFDLAVLDMKMPGLAGLALKERLQAQDPRLKFIFLTGYGSEEVFEDIRRDYAGNVFLIKPVDIDELMGAMRAVMTAAKED
jgi:DNA-binding response OmpR family regulator